MGRALARHCSSTSAFGRRTPQRGEQGTQWGGNPRSARMLRRVAPGRRPGSELESEGEGGIEQIRFRFPSHPDAWPGSRGFGFRGRLRAHGHPAEPTDRVTASTAEITEARQHRGERRGPHPWPTASAADFAPPHTTQGGPPRPGHRSLPTGPQEASIGWLGRFGVEEAALMDERREGGAMGIRVVGFNRPRWDRQAEGIDPAPTKSNCGARRTNRAPCFSSAGDQRERTDQSRGSFDLRGRPFGRGRLWTGPSPTTSGIVKGVGGCIRDGRRPRRTHHQHQSSTKGRSQTSSILIGSSGARSSPTIVWNVVMVYESHPGPAGGPPPRGITFTTKTQHSPFRLWPPAKGPPGSNPVIE